MVVVFYTQIPMQEDPKIKLLKTELGKIYQQIRDKKYKVRKKQKQLDIIQQERNKLITEISNLTSEAELIQKKIDELNG